MNKGKGKEMYYLGIDIGGTQIKAVVLDAQGEVIEQSKLETEDSALNPEIWKLKIFGLIQSKTEELVKGDPSKLRCGISAPGLADGGNTKILYMPERLKGIENFDWSKELDREVTVLNDAHAACLAEYYGYFQSQNIKNMLLLTLGTGVGGGVIINGELYQGAMQRAGHFGHTTVDHMGNPTMTNMVGSLEYAFGNFSVKERTHGQFDSVKDLVAAYHRGETLATYWWLSSVQKLATALASLTNAFAPELIVLGGGIAAGAGDLLMKPLQEFLPLYSWSPDGSLPEIKAAHFQGYAGAMGAAFYAKSKFKTNQK
ncbi:ROK family protein [Algoriphagus aestuarii]|nr:ROK family protein [Algoriphagus aestuarii]